MHPVFAWMLAPATLIYAAAIRLRNRRYDSGRVPPRRVRVPVISVGNLTAGGTGKTPFVMEIVRRLKQLGRRPGILTRGYGAGRGRTADEVLEYQAGLPDSLVYVNPDRVAGAEEAVRSGRVDCLVLDDGFQHRRIARDLDIVLVDALAPWGGGWLLPSGRLREPLSSLARADVVVITRANQADAAALRAIERRLDDAANRAEIIWANVEPAELAFRDGRTASVGDLAYHNLLAVCGIGNPATFVRLVEAHAGSVSATLVFRDHHRYRPADVRRMLALARRHGADLVVTTRKDWVKLAPLWPTGKDEGPELARLEVQVTLDDPDDVLDEALRAALGPVASR